MHSAYLWRNAWYWFRQCLAGSYASYLFRCVAFSVVSFTKGGVRLIILQFHPRQDSWMSRVWLNAFAVWKDVVKVTFLVPETICVETWKRYGPKSGYQSHTADSRSCMKWEFQSSWCCGFYHKWHGQLFFVMKILVTHWSSDGVVLLETFYRKFSTS